MNLVLHIGLHKTATTTLQRQIFPRLQGVHYIDAALSSAAATLYRCGVQDPIYFQADAARSAIEEVCRPDDINLVSAEGLSGSLYSAVGKRDLDHRHNILTNLERAFPQARILLVIRRQDEYARSVYRQYIKKGGVLGPDEFFGATPEQQAYFPRDRFCYPNYVAHLRRRFSAGVHVAVYEQLVESPAAFLQDMAGFLGVAPPSADLSLRWTNRSRLGATGLAVCGYLNRWFRSDLNPGAPLPGIPRRRRSGDWTSVSPVLLLQDIWPGSGRVSDDSALGRACRQILETQAAPNERLEREFGLQLRKYGYF